MHLSVFFLYRAIHKSLRDFRTRLRNNQDRHGRKEHINREIDTPSFCPTLKVLDMCTLVDFWELLTNVSRTRSTVSADGPGRPVRFAAHRQPATLLEFHVPFTNCFFCRWFCVVHDPKPPLHCHNWLSFGKFQDTERFLIHYERHFSSRLPHSGGNCKYAKASSTKKTWRDSLPIDMFLSAVSVLVVAQSSSENPEGLTNNPVYICACVGVCNYRNSSEVFRF